MCIYTQLLIEPVWMMKPGAHADSAEREQLMLRRLILELLLVVDAAATSAALLLPSVLSSLSSSHLSSCSLAPSLPFLRSCAQTC